MTTYKKLSNQYLKEAEKYLKQRKYRQAGEKYWGAAATAVKNYAQKNNLSHDGHHKLFSIVSELARTKKDYELLSLFSCANQLHINFYENYLSLHDVKYLSKQVKKFISKMNKF